MHWKRTHCRSYLSNRKLKAYNCAAVSARVQRPRWDSRLQGIPGSNPGGVAQEGFPFNRDIVLCRRGLTETARVVDELDMHACLIDKAKVSAALAFPEIALTMRSNKKSILPAQRQ